MRKVDNGEEKKEKEKRKKEKRMAFLVATTSLLAVYRPNGYARTTTAGTPHARAKNKGLYINGVLECREVILKSKIWKVLKLFGYVLQAVQHCR